MRNQAPIYINSSDRLNGSGKSGLVIIVWIARVYECVWKYNNGCSLK